MTKEEFNELRVEDMVYIWQKPRWDNDPSSPSCHEVREVCVGGTNSMDAYLYTYAGHHSWYLSPEHIFLTEEEAVASFNSSGFA